MESQFMLLCLFNPNWSLDHNMYILTIVWYCFLTSFLFLSTSCLFLLLDVARYACAPKTNNLFDNKTRYVQALKTELGLKFSYIFCKIVYIFNLVIKRLTYISIILHATISVQRLYTRIKPLTITCNSNKCVRILTVNVIQCS